MPCNILMTLKDRRIVITVGILGSLYIFFLLRFAQNEIETQDQSREEILEIINNAQEKRKP